MLPRENCHLLETWPKEESLVETPNFEKRRVTAIMKIAYLLAQVKFYSHWNYRNVNKLNWMPPVTLNNKLPGIMV